MAQSLCHCRTCRLASGAPSVAWVVFPSRDFVFIAGQSARFRSSPEVVRTFCARCGSPLTYRHDSSPDTVDVTTATVDFPDRFAPTREIWLEHKLAWEQLDENLAHYPRSNAEGQSISS
ncbi:MAG: GFA family protein [Betaproteobacteria bacterium]|nr:MAG: GFA family protein [Betaproteobacteria bacterium]